MSLSFSTAEPGAEASLDTLFEELALSQKSGKEHKEKHQLSMRFAPFPNVTSSSSFNRRQRDVIADKWLNPINIKNQAFSFFKT